MLLYVVLLVCLFLAVFLIDAFFCFFTSFTLFHPAFKTGEEGIHTEDLESDLGMFKSLNGKSS